MSNNDDPLAEFEGMMRQEQKVKDEMTALRERIRDIALTTKAPPLHERRKPDNYVQTQLGLRKIWRKGYPEPGKRQFVAQYTEFEPVSDESEAQELDADVPILDEEDDGIEESQEANLSSLWFEMPDGTAVYMRILYEANLDVFTHIIDIKPPDAEKYGFVYPEQADPYIEHAKTLLDAYDQAMNTQPN